ncbi:65-kDa microtubule-associated protein 8 isoform X1 [Typha latifolia]|uniref:65-kDa microtubule-associated protein 8 isoform X1 n=2 Tax=Typha latifolia TaxID=4733 RepID=UPI003C3087C3
MVSIQMAGNSPASALPESSCAYLLQELKMIWDEVGQDQQERERILLELEQECLDVYRRKVDTANISRVRLHQALADSEAEFTNLLLSLGERSFPGRPEKLTGTLKEQLDSITPALQEMQMRKEERLRQFREVQTEIQKISSEISGESPRKNVAVNEADLSLKKLVEYQNELQRLLKEKSDRLRRVEEYKIAVYDLAATMGMDAVVVIADVHQSLLDASGGKQSKNISDDVLDKLRCTVENLKGEKKMRMEKLCNLEKALTNLWNLLDTSFEDQKPFAHIRIFSSSTCANGILSPGSLTLATIEKVESEVERLDQLKASKMKELYFKKQIELEEICKRSHLELPSQLEMDRIMNLIIAGDMDHVDLLKRMEDYISKAKDEACSRKDIMDKVEKWMASCDEERWLEEYSRDENRYSVSRGAHKNLRRAERARITVNKIPALLELLMMKTKIWEEERKKVFLYDELPLLAMLQEYALLRQEKEEEKYRQRERKKIQTQLVKVQESSFGSRPRMSSSRLSNRSLNSSFASPSPLNKRLSDNNYPDQESSLIRKGRKAQMQKKIWNNRHDHSLKVDTASEISATFSGPTSP